jgi:hypothetical protein
MGVDGANETTPFEEAVMAISILFQCMKKAVSQSTHNREYAAGRARQSALSAYPSALAALEALTKGSALTPPERGEIVAAFVAEERRAAHPLWQGLLYSAFGPMLLRLRGRVGKKSDDDCDQKIVLAFLEAFRSMSLDIEPRFAPLAIRRATVHAIFSDLASAREAPPIEAFDDELHEDLFVTEEKDARGTDALGMVKSAEKNTAVTEALLAMHDEGLSLKDFVVRRYAQLSEKERASMYQRLRGAQRRAVLRLRAPTGAAA